MYTSFKMHLSNVKFATVFYTICKSCY